MNDFAQALQGWQLFYATVAGASATLSGLLFVALSLHPDRLKGNRAKVILATARRTFSDFLYVLMIALVFLAPHQVAFSLTTALWVLGLARGVGLIREVAKDLGQQARHTATLMILREVGFPFLASLGLISVGTAIAFGKTDSMYGLVGVIAALLTSACWHAWLLLVED